MITDSVGRLISGLFKEVGVKKVSIAHFIRKEHYLNVLLP
jgi:hypothetical protein